MSRWICGVCAVVVLSGWPSLAADENWAERVFRPGQRVWMDLSAGKYIIRAGRDDRIRVDWAARDPDARRPRVRVDSREREGSIVVRGASEEYRFVIELPAQTDLVTRMSAGDLTIRGISGNKDVSSWAGQIDIDVGRPSDYRLVEASVTAGEIRAAPFEARKGGLFRSLSWRGPGRYSLEVRLTAGEMRLR